MRSSFWKMLSIAIGFIGFIGGILISKANDSFNIYLLLTTWISTALFDFIFVGFYNITYNQELIYNKILKQVDSNNYKYESDNVKDNDYKKTNLKSFGKIK